MKRGIFTKTIIILLLLAGLSFLLYPTVSNLLFEWNAKQVVGDYAQQAKQMNQETIDQTYAEAKAYNDALLIAGYPITDAFFKEEEKFQLAYDDVLNPGHDGVMAYVDIPKIGVELPIYHGTSEEILKKGVGHLRQTSLPIGGEGYHSVLTGHSGLSQAKLFTDLTQVEESDIFYVHVLNQTLAYQVDQIEVVLPEETDDLYPVEGEDYVTLVTCTPYAINSHRLLVRGSRIPYEDAVVLQPEMQTNLWWYVLWIIVGAVVIVVLIVVLVRRKKKRKNGESQV